MSDHTTLLIEIYSPDAAEPVCLMNGRGFDVLRKDSTGQEVYGLAHQGKEYLLFPLDFRPLDAGKLAVIIPSEYEDWFFDATVEGARIVFSSTHGTPFFAEMPEEYHSNTGILRFDGSGKATVLLDRVTQDRNEADCACGHEHAHGHAPHDSCGCGQHSRSSLSFPPARVTQEESEREIAQKIRESAKELNVFLQRAAEVGLVVEADMEHVRAATPKAQDCLQIHITGVLKPL